MNRELIAKIASNISKVEGAGVFVEADGTVSFNGMNQKTYDAYRKRKDKPIRDVKQIQYGEFLDILEEDFIKPNGINKLPEDVLPIVVDMSFNSGPGNAARMLQRTVGAEEDGIIGPNTLKALEKYRNENNFIDGFTKTRENFIMESQDPKVIKYRDGILNRINNVRDIYSSDQ